MSARLVQPTGIILLALLHSLAQADSPELGAEIDLADRVVVVKSERKLYLLKDGERLREMDIALGLVPTGHKTRSGDARTPEGIYMLDARNPDSDYFLSMHVSYPNDADIARARELGVDPGGQIMIHGLPNEMRYEEANYQGWDWTDGCIAVSNTDMIDIWLMTPDMTPIEIRP
ncbi:MAG: L,D-transpeptidase family protein [Gammaproteobacteria bacterium]|jgi:murein L,D-transpeptidase YafK